MRLRHVLLALLAFVAVLAVAALALLWRLTEGPVDAGLIAPRIEAALSRPERGYRVRLGSVQVEWAGWRRLLRFQAADARLVDLQDRPLIESRGLEFALDPGALLGGRVAPRRVALLGVTVGLRRRADGSLALRAGTDGEAETPLAALGLLQGLPSGGGAPAEIGIRGAAVAIRDDALGVEWALSGLNLAFRDAGLARGSASIRVGGLETDIDIALRPEGRAGGPALTLGFEGVRPDRVAALHPALARLGHVTTALTGELSLAFDAEGALAALGAELRGTGGAIAGLDGEGAVALDRLFAKLDARDGLSRWTFDRIEIGSSGRVARLSGSATRADGALDISAQLEALAPELLLPLAGPRFAPLAALEAPLSGAVTLALDAEDRPVSFSADLALGAGALQVPETDAGAVGVRSGALQARLDGSAGALAVERLRLDLERGWLEASGTAEQAADGWRVALTGKAGDLPVDDFRRLWPRGVGAPFARTWILANLSLGSIDTVEIALRTDLSLEPEIAVGALELDGRLAFSGITARYWEPLPAVREVSGSAVFDSRDFALSLTGGHWRDVRIAGGSLDFTDLHRYEPPSMLAADVRLEGPLGQVLELVDREPLGYAAYLGVDPAAAEGSVQGSLRVRLPLLVALTLEQVEIEAVGSVADAALPLAALGRRLDGARLDMQVDKQRLHLSGEGALDGVTAAFELENRFSEADPVRYSYRARARVDHADLARFGFDPAPYLTGPVDLEVAGADYRDRPGEYEVKAELAASRIDLAPLGWTKPAGEPAWLAASLRFGEDGPVEVPALEAAGPGLDFAGWLRLDADSGRLLEGALQRLRLGERTELALEAVRGADGALALSASGPSVDLDRLFAGERAGEDADAFAISLDVERAWIGGATPLHGLKGQVRLEGGRVVEAQARASAGNGAAISALVAPEAGGRRIELRAEDTGALLSTLGWYRNLLGGRLQFDLAPAAEGGQQGAVRIDGFRVRNAPAFARLLAAASLTGIGDLLSTDAGLGFERLEASLAMRDRRIDFGPGRVFGTSIGVTFEGAFDRDSERVAMKGALVPAYVVTRFLGAIPVLGALLTGGGEGVIAANYALSGPMDDLQTSVNPLSALAPGFLRRLFGPLLGAEGRDWDPEEGAGDPAAP